MTAETGLEPPADSPLSRLCECEAHDVAGSLTGRRSLEGGTRCPRRVNICTDWTGRHIHPKRLCPVLCVSGVFSFVKETFFWLGGQSVAFHNDSRWRCGYVRSNIHKLRRRLVWYGKKARDQQKKRFIHFLDIRRNAA